MTNAVKRVQKIHLPYLCRRQRSDNSGSILILVVWTIAFLSFLAVGFGLRSIFSINLVARFQDELRSHYIARSAVLYAGGIVQMDGSDTFDGAKDIWFDNEYKFRSQSFGGGEFTITNQDQNPVTGTAVTRYGLMDEDRKINLNTADAAMLQNLFEIIGGLDEGQARTFADEIIDWRDEDSDRRPFGAEKYDYLGGEDSYECADGPFQSVEELQLIRGMTSEIYDQVVPYVTAFGSGQVNLNTTNLLVLRVLGLSEQGAKMFYMNRIGPDEVEGTEDDYQFNSVSAAISSVSDLIPREDTNKLTELLSEKLVGVMGGAFSFNVESTMGKSQGAMRVDCVLDRKGNILSWFER